MNVISRLCDTSSAMFKHHYSNIKPEMFADALSEVTLSKEKPKPKKLANQQRNTACHIIHNTDLK